MFTHFFIDRPILSSVISILFVLAGLVAMSVAPIEQYPELLRATHVQMGASVQALERAGAEYRVAASVYTDAAKSSLQTFANQKAEEILAIQSTTQAGQDVTSTLSIKQAILASAALSSFLTALAVLAAQRLS